MPRVGSSRISTLGAVWSHLARTTFCWFPPDRLATLCSMEGVRTPSRATLSRASARSAPARTKPSAETLPREARETFSRTAMGRITPCSLRSSVTKPMPAAMASPGPRGLTRRPSTRISPAPRRSAPNRHRAISVRPDPTRPANATTSPAWTVKLMSRRTPRRDRPRTSSTGRPGARATLGNDSSISRPTIRRRTSSRLISPMGPVPTERPSRRTVTRWAIWNTSSIRCEM